MEQFDLVIIGAGVNGLLTAKTYLEVNPFANIVILDQAQSLGGVWAKERLYPGLKTNNMLGTYEFSDFPLTESRFGVRKGHHIPGPVLHEYLEQYAEEFDLVRRVRLDCKVHSAEWLKGHAGNGWLLVASQSKGPETSLQADKMVVATGLTSEPFLPAFAGDSDFNAPLFHVKELHTRAESLQEVRNVAVLGTSKSAFDTCYHYAEVKGEQVNWIIRSSGHGPVWNAPPYVTPFGIWLEKLILTRFLTWFSPCSYADADGYSYIRRFLHGTRIGRLLVSGFWGVLGNDLVTLTGINKHPETKKLLPWNEPFWIASGLSILNYDTDFFALVREGKIKVHIADVTNLSDHTIHLSDNTSIAADVLICSTGWVQQPPIQFLPEGSEEALGLPYYSSEPNKLAKKADAEILARFPHLKSQPPRNKACKPLLSSSEISRSHAPNQTYRLYRFIAPSSPALFNSRSIAFSGALLSVSTTTVSQPQALWITAYLGNKLPPVNQAQVEWETVLHTQFGKWRHPASAGGYGERFPDMAFDSLPYVDLLLRDLGLRTHRKVGSGLHWKEWFVLYEQGDYCGLVEEWMRRLREQGEGQKKDS